MRQSLVVWLFAPGAVFAQEEAPTAEAILARIQELDKSTTLTDETKSSVRDLYQQVLAELKAVSEETARAERFSQTARTAPEDLGRARRELSLLPEAPENEMWAGQSLERLQVRLTEREAELAQLKKEFERLNNEPKRRAARRLEIPKQRAVVRKQLDELKRQLEAEPPASDTAELILARRTHLQAKTRVLQQTLAAGTNELEAYLATIDLLPLELELAAARVALLQREVKALRTNVGLRRAGEVDAHLRESSEHLRQVAHSASLTSMARANLQLVQSRKQLRERFEDMSREQAEIGRMTESLNQQRTRIEDKVKTVGLTGAIGLMLRKQKSQLPELSGYRGSVRQRQPTLKTAQLSALELEDRRADLADLDGALEQIQTQIKFAAGKPMALEDQQQLRKLLTAERRYTDFLITDSNTYLEKLIELDRAQRQLMADTEEFEQYIDERVLWVRSAETLSFGDLPLALEALRHFANGRPVRRVAAALAADLQVRSDYYVLVLAVAALALFAGWRLKIHRIRPRAEEKRPSRLSRLLREVLEIALRALPLPLLLWFVGERLSGLPSESGWDRALGAGLTSAARDLLPLLMLLRMCRTRGFARRYLGWSGAGVRRIRGMLIVLILAALPLTFVHAALKAQDNVRWQDSLGRICFVVHVLIVALVVERLLRPRVGVLYQTLRPTPVDVLSRLRWVWYLVGVGAHLGLAVMAIVGYTYAADRLGRQVRATALLLSGLLLIGSLLMQWIRLNSRRLALRRLAETRAAKAAAKTAAQLAAEMGLPRADTDNGWSRETKKSDSKMRPLVSTMLVMANLVGLWLIWGDVIPAFNVVNHIKLWDTEVVVTQKLGGDEAAAVRRAPEFVPVTLGDLLLAVFVVSGTIVAARYIAGLFELPVLDRLPLDSALRNTITTVTRYVLWIAAVIVAARFLGIGWAKVQWMAAALSLGLGFGLQEIFANFISGLIILFERPMRVGDVITIGDTTGVVQAIRMRATTITDWDRKELVVPNKEFATGRLLNWTLTNKTNRRVIEVGVEYGTDPDLVRDLLLKVARQSPRVLETPKPVALFEKFGESVLIFSLRVYHPKISDRLRGLHELNTAIQREFNNAGVKFAFPQRDLHLRTPAPPTSWFEPEAESGLERDGADAQT